MAPRSTLYLRPPEPDIVRAIMRSIWAPFCAESMRFHCWQLSASAAGAKQNVAIRTASKALTATEHSPDAGARGGASWAMMPA